MQSLTAVKKMIGERGYRGVIVATTRWDEVVPEQMHLASQREQELRRKVADIVE
jgi:hypothetical protein